MEINNNSRRPSEIIRNYLEAEFRRPDMTPGTRLPAINAIARHLQVSPTTVQTVVAQLAEEGKIQRIPGKGIYFNHIPPTTDSNSPKTIAINLASPQIRSSDIWSGLIALGIMEEFSRETPNLLLRSFSPDQHTPQSLEKECLNSDGAILFNTSNSEEWRTIYDKYQKPVVSINPPYPNHTRNFVSTDYYDNAYRLGQTWKGNGRKHICVILPAAPGVSVSAMFTLMGFTAAVESSPATTRCTHIVPKPGQSAAELIDELLSLYGTLPDALYTYPTALAENLVQELRNRDYNVPSDVSIAAGTSDEHLQERRMNLSVFSLSLKQFGAEAAKMLRWRLAHPGESASGVYLPCQFIAGSTTTPEENQWIAGYSSISRS